MIRILEAVESYQRRCGLTSGPQFVRFILQLENSLFFYSIKLHKRNYLTFLFCLLSWIQNSNHYDNQEREDVVHKENLWQFETKLRMSDGKLSTNDNKL